MNWSALLLVLGISGVLGGLGGVLVQSIHDAYGSPTNWKPYMVLLALGVLLLAVAAGLGVQS